MVLSTTLLVIFAFSIGVILMIASYRFPPISKVTRYIRRPLFFTSGTLFASTQIPPMFLKFILWNPIFHAIELARVGAAKDYVLVSDISLIYLFESSILALFISIIIYAKNKDLILKS